MSAQGRLPELAGGRGNPPALTPGNFLGATVAKRKYHYVYALIDPRTCSPFYIGKGTGERKVQHFQNIPKRYQGEKGSDKHTRIEEIKKAGLIPTVTVLSYHDTDDDALEAEVAMIKQIGLENLVNENLGGGGDRSKKKQTATRTDDRNVLAFKARALTPKQEDFCMAIVDPDCPNQSEAYKKAFNAKRMSDRAVAVEASKLMKRPDITLRIEELRNIVLGEKKYSMRQAIEGQERAVELADDTGAAAAMSGAYREIAKLSNLYPKDEGNKEGVTINIHNEIRLTKVELARRTLHTLQAGLIEDRQNGKP